MKTPRDVSGYDLIKVLSRYGYQTARQVGSYVRMTRKSNEGDQHVTIPLHNPIKVGTLNDILNDVAKHLNISKEDILKK